MGRAGGYPELVAHRPSSADRQMEVRRMDDTRQVTTPEQLHSDLREMRKERKAEAEAVGAETNDEIATEAEVRSGLQVEEAERWGDSGRRGHTRGDDPRGRGHHRARG